MAEPINLRRVRKAGARAAAEAGAAANRLAYGRPKAARDLAQARADLAAQRLDGHRRTTAPDTSSD